MWPQGLYQGTWNSPVTSRVLLEAGASLTKNPFPCSREDVTQTYGFAVSPTDVSILERSTGFRYNAANTYLYTNDMDRYHERFSVSYVTGSHTLKIGFETQQHHAARETVVNSDVTYTFLNRVPTTITQWATPYLEVTKTKADAAVYAQDRWNYKRLTLNYGVRFDYFNSYVPPQHVDATQFLPARDYEAVEGVPEWFDLNPRLGGSYDLFGTGRTALKASLGRYVGKHGIDIALANSPITTSVNNANRSWTDRDGDYVPDCTLTNFAANGECGPIANVNFGQLNPNAVRYAEDMTRGFGKRDYFWDMSAELQHEFRQGVSGLIGYYRNWSDHYPSYPAATTSGVAGHEDNLALTPEDFDPYCITAPVDARLPGGGGYPVCGLYNIRPEKFGVGNVVISRASHFGGKSLVQDYVTTSFNTRFANGIVLSANLDLGRTVEDNCFVIDSPQQLLHCRIVRPFSSQTQVKISGVYPLPAGFIVSGVFQNLSGIPYNANYEVTSGVVAQSLGRPLSGGTTTVTVPLVAPFTQFEPRRNLLDLRISKAIAMGARARLKVNLDLYNVLNDASILEINSNYGPGWLQGQGRGGGIILSRLMQVGGQFTF
jgi:hypothetical protein